MTNASLNQGSSPTLCDENLLEPLAVPRERINFTLTTVNKTSECQRGFKARLSVASLYENRYIRLPNVFSSKSLPIVCPHQPYTETLKRRRHLDGVTIPKRISVEVLLLFVVDVPEVFWSLETRCGKPDKPYAFRTPLEWSLICPRPNSKLNVYVNHVWLGDELLEKQVAKQWQLKRHQPPQRSKACQKEIAML